jgi:hypothetical protein
VRKNEVIDKKTYVYAFINVCYYYHITNHFSAEDKSLSVTPRIKIQMLQGVYEMVCALQIAFGFEVWGMNE